MNDDKKKSEQLVPTEDMTTNFTKDLIEKYRKIWMKACTICTKLNLKNLYYFGVGNANFATLLPASIIGNDKDIKAIETSFNKTIFEPAFGIKIVGDQQTEYDTNDTNTPYKYCKDKEIKIQNYPAANIYENAHAMGIPKLLFGPTFTEELLKYTLFINAWDPWSIIGNGNDADNSLDGFWGRNSNLSVLGWSETNPYLTQGNNSNYLITEQI